MFRLRRELVRREGQLSVLACRGISWRSIVVGRPPPRPPYACWTGRCPHGSEEPAKKEKGEQQTLETILLVQALVVSEAGAACAGSLWAKTGGGCSPRSHQRLWKNPKASERPAGGQEKNRRQMGTGQGQGNAGEPGGTSLQRTWDDFFAGSHDTSFVRRGGHGAVSRCRARASKWPAIGQPGGRS